MAWVGTEHLETVEQAGVSVFYRVKTWCIFFKTYRETLESQLLIQNIQLLPEETSVYNQVPVKSFLSAWGELSDLEFAGALSQACYKVVTKTQSFSFCHRTISSCRLEGQEQAFHHGMTSRNVPADQCKSCQARYVPPASAVQVKGSRMGQQPWSRPWSWQPAGQDGSNLKGYESHRAEKSPKPILGSSSFQRESCQPGLEPPYQGQQVLYSTNIPSSRTGVCRTTPCYTSPCESRRQQIPNQQPSKWFSLKMQLSLDNRSITIWTAGWRLIPWELGLAARHCTAHTGLQVSSDSRPKDIGIPEQPY